MRLAAKYIDFRMATCAGCLKGISDKEWVKTEDGRQWHNACFQCKDCSRPLTAKDKYFVIPSPSPRIASFPRCPDCQKNYNCVECGGTIAVLVYKKHGKSLYHTDCFRCKSCNGGLGKDPREHDGLLFCAECDDKGFRGKCVRCGKSCRGDFTEALQKQYHASCLTCYKCNKEFEGGKFYVVNDEPRCKDHAH